ncbi:hypothetical protein SK128_022008 [Halocaridina rubra]|uniref:Uncharacterized protein n=1 Tax=Halocaridina rubra TaxID=373956 RepID=A0AAN8X3B6_HALRR
MDRMNSLPKSPERKTRRYSAGSTPAEFQKTSQSNRQNIHVAPLDLASLKGSGEKPEVDSPRTRRVSRYAYQYNDVPKSLTSQKDHSDEVDAQRIRRALGIPYDEDFSRKNRGLVNKDFHCPETMKDILHLQRFSF